MAGLLQKQAELGTQLSEKLKVRAGVLRSGGRGARLGGLFRRGCCQPRERCQEGLRKALIA